MGKKAVDFQDHVAETIRALDESRVLMVSQGTSGIPNAMAIGWGSIGVIWRKSLFVVLVRPQRYTYKLVEETGEFTVNVLAPGFKEAVEYCGTVSGRDHDKFKEKQLTAIPSLNVAPPLIKEATLHFECRVVYKNDLVPSALAEPIPSLLYPKRDFHRVFFGEILACQREL